MVPIVARETLMRDTFSNQRLRLVLITLLVVMPMMCYLLNYFSPR